MQQRKGMGNAKKGKWNKVPGGKQSSGRLLEGVILEQDSEAARE